MDGAISVVMSTVHAQVSLLARVRNMERKLNAIHRYHAQRDADLAVLHSTQEKLVWAMGLGYILWLIAYAYEHIVLVAFVASVGYSIARIM